MKFMKYTFRTPLHGSIDCSDVLPKEEPIALSPRKMCRLYSEYEELSEFLNNNLEDLADFVCEELQNVVLRAEFGDYAMHDGKMYLMTYVWTRGELSSEKLARLMDWILGQMSDGWGEHLEQQAWMEERVETPQIYFDEESLKFETDYDSWLVYYYIHAWVSDDDYQVVLQECEEVATADAELVAFLSIPAHERKVFKVPNELALKNLLRNFARTELIHLIEKVCSEPGCTYYLAFEGATETELLPTWACNYSGEDDCFVYYKDPNSGLCCMHSRIATEEAILKLLA